MLFTVYHFIKWYFTPEKLIEYLPAQDYFVLTSELFEHHITPNLDLKDLYTLTRVCKFYNTNNHLRNKIKTIRIEHYLNRLYSSISGSGIVLINSGSGIVFTNYDKLILKHKTILELLNPFLFTNELKLRYNPFYFGPSDSNTSWLTTSVTDSFISFESYKNRYKQYEKLEDIPPELMIVLKESQTVLGVVYGYTNYYDIHCKKQWLSEHNKQVLIYNGLLMYGSLITGLIASAIINGQAQ